MGLIYLYLHIHPKTTTNISSYCLYFLTSYVSYKQKTQTPYVTAMTVNKPALGPTPPPTGVAFLVSKTAEA